MRLLFVTVFPLGLLAAVNPCGFPLLPAYLARFSAPTGAEPGQVARARVALLRAGAMTLGFLAVFTAVGAAASLVLRIVLAVVPPVLIAVGVGLLLVAVLSAVGRMPVLKRLDVRFQRGTGSAAAFGFGLAYGAASLGCALPLFAAAIGEAALAHGWQGVLVAGGAYALGMGVLVTGVGLLIAVFGSAAARALSGIGRITPLLSALATGVTGVALTFVGLRDLGMPAPAVVSDAQSGLAALLGRSPALLGGLLGAVVVVWLAVVAVHEVRSEAHR